VSFSSCFLTTYTADSIWHDPLSPVPFCNSLLPNTSLSLLSSFPFSSFRLSFTSYVFHQSTARDRGTDFGGWHSEQALGPWADLSQSTAKRSRNGLRRLALRASAWDPWQDLKAVVVEETSSPPPPPSLPFPLEIQSPVHCYLWSPSPQVSASVSSSVDFSSESYHSTFFTQHFHSTFRFLVRLPVPSSRSNATKFSPSLSLPLSLFPSLSPSFLPSLSLSHSFVRLLSLSGLSPFTFLTVHGLDNTESLHSPIPLLLPFPLLILLSFTQTVPLTKSWTLATDIHTIESWQIYYRMMKV
jgi:hypothetical protein